MRRHADEVRVLLVGECNPYSSDPEAALFPHPRGSAGHRLSTYLCASRAEYLRRFARRNLCARVWDAQVAEREADRVLLPVRPAVLLGARVAAAAGYDDLPLFERRGYIVRLPHPSGRSRVWNDPDVRRRAREAVEELEAAWRAA